MKTFVCGMLLAATVAPAVGLAGESHPPHWTYEGKEGPANWAKLSPEYGACAGKEQSPIDLGHLIEAELDPLKPAYQAGGRELVNNGHTEQLGFAPGSSITVDGVRFELKQMHFHAPSENLVHGKSFPMEAHLVHADKDGNLAVVALMFEAGAENKALAQIWPKLPDKAGGKAELAAPFAASTLLPAKLDYFRFSGSLTTPPCSEGVRWLVLKAPVTASKEQLHRFAELMHHPNNRPVQPVNARPVLQ